MPFLQETIRPRALDHRRDLRLMPDEAKETDVGHLRSSSTSDPECWTNVVSCVSTDLWGSQGKEHKETDPQDPKLTRRKGLSLTSFS